MLKKFTFPLLIFTIVFQISVPIFLTCVSFGKNQNAVIKGTTYNMYADINSIVKNKVYIYLCTVDGSVENAVGSKALVLPNYNIDEVYETNGEGPYLTLTRDENGFAKAVGIFKEPPEGDAYISVGNTLYTELEYKASNSLERSALEGFTDYYNNGEYDVVAEVCVYNGCLTVTGVFIDGIPIEKYGK